MLPEDLPNWETRELELGATESLNEASREILRLDDFVHRQYSQPGRTFSVYIGYWRPGKMPVRLINQHTPDRCWLENGWSCVDREWNVEYEGPDQDLQPAQLGLYEIQGFETYAMFWHLVDGEAYWAVPGQLNSRTRVGPFLKELFAFKMQTKREQIFIRINSNVPFDEIWETDGFQKVLDVLEDRWLAESKPAEPV